MVHRNDVGDSLSLIEYRDMHQTIHSNGYTFALDTSKEYDDVIVYQFISLQKQPYPCIRITIYDDIANIDALNYYSSCSMSEKSLDKAHGTVHMMKTALSFVSQKHPQIRDFELQDETFIDAGEKPLITSRRLLQGKQGWYEEHFGAIPTGSTKTLLRFLRDPNHRRMFEDRIPKENIMWWTATNIMNVCHTIKCPNSILGTTWKITKNIIDTYDIKYESKTMSGGGTHRRHISRILRNARGFSYDTKLNAKYRQ